MISSFPLTCGSQKSPGYTSYIDIGLSVFLSLSRSLIQFPSVQLKLSISHTILDLPGLSSCLNEYGSAFFCSIPPRILISYSYSAPSFTPGINISNTPDDPSLLIWCILPSQLLKPPITLTRTAFGAHKAKSVPSVPSIFLICDPRYSYAFSLSPFENLSRKDVGICCANLYESAVFRTDPSANSARYV